MNKFSLWQPAGQSLAPDEPSDNAPLRNSRKFCPFCPILAKKNRWPTRRDLQTGRTRGKRQGVATVAQQTMNDSNDFGLLSPKTRFTTEGKLCDKKLQTAAPMRRRSPFAVRGPATFGLLDLDAQVRKSKSRRRFSNQFRQQPSRSKDFNAPPAAAGGKTFGSHLWGPPTRTQIQKSQKR